MSDPRLPKSKLIQVLIFILALAGAFPLIAQPGIPGGGSGGTTNCTADGILAELERTNHVILRCSGTITLTNPIVITGDVIIEATNRATFSGNNTSRIFSVQSGGTLTLINLTLTGGRAGTGGAIRNEGTLLLTNCVLSGNNATGATGAKGADGRDDNTSPTDGGDGQAGSQGIGGAIWNNGSLTAHQCTFGTNAATGGNGGAGGKGGNGINGSFFSGDGGNGGTGATGRGGALYNTGASEALLFECVFHQNRAVGGNGGAFGAGGTGGIAGQGGRGGIGGIAAGAAIFNASPELDIDSCTFSDNRADGGDAAATGGEDTNGAGNDGVSGGQAWGAAVANLNIADVINSTFSTNRVFGGDGGKGADGSTEGGRGGNGGTAYGGNIYNNGETAIINCTFASGVARGGTNGVGGGGPTPGGNGTRGGNSGGNLASVGGSLDIKNSIVCRQGTGINGFGSIFDAGHNIVSDNSIPLSSGSSRVIANPRIGGLADNGGFGRTFALLEDSPAIDEGDPVDAPEVDQRRFPRFGDYPDIGAYEFAASSITVNVADIDGNPIEGVQVVVNGVTNFTGGDGISVFPPLPEGEYTVTPSHALYTFDPPSETVELGPAVELFFTALRTFSISGFITDGTSGIEDLTVTIGNQETQTGTNGFYEITGLEAGSYEVVPSSPDGFAFIPSLQQVDLHTNVANVNFTAAGIYSVSGRITEGSQGIANVTVRAGNRTAVTGPSGDYTINQLPQRPQVVTPSLTGYSFIPQSHPITPTTDENGIDFTGYVSFQVSGVVLNSSNGFGANAVTLTLRTNANPLTPVDSTQLLTDTNGLFSFTNIRAGSYVLTPTKSAHGFAPASSTFTLGPSTNFTYSMFPAFSMSGRVTVGASGLSNATVTVYTNGGTKLGEFTTPASGNYSFTNFPPGTYELRPSSLEGYAFTPTNRIVVLNGHSNNLNFAAAGFAIHGAITKDGLPHAGVTVRTTGAVSITDAAGLYALTNLGPGTFTVTPTQALHSLQPLNASVTLGPGNPSQSNVNFQAVNVYTIQGEVLEHGVPLIGVRVSAGGVTNFTAPGDNGRYTLRDVPAGPNVMVNASMPGYALNPPQQSIVLNGPKNGVNFSARGLSAVAGRVTNISTGNGLGSVRIAVDGRYETNTSPTGFYVLTNLGPGLHTIVPSRTNVGTFGFDPASLQFTVATNSVTNNINFGAFNSARLFGRVTEEGSTNGVQGVTVRAQSTTSTNIVTTDVNGNYDFPALRLGNYSLTPSRSGRGFDPKFYDVSFSTSTNVRRDFVSFPGFSISGRVTDPTTGIGVGGFQVNVSAGITSTNTDSQGNYSFAALREGDYTVTPADSGYESSPEERKVSLGPTNAANVNFTARGKLTVTGTVVDGAARVPNMQIRIVSAETNNPPPVSRTGVTDASGRFTFTNLPPGLLSINPVLFDLFTPSNVVINPLLYDPPVFSYSAGGGKLFIARSTNGIKLTLRALPGRLFAIQTNRGAGSWVDHRFPLVPNSNAVVDYFPPTNILSNPTLLFRSRR